MGKRCLVFLGLMSWLVLAQAVDVLAAAFEGPGVGVRPLTMGGAFIGLADDWTAFVWNPAGLAQLEGKGAGFSLDYVPAKASDGNSVANPPATAVNIDQKDIFFQFGGEPTQFNKQDVESTVWLPTIGGYTQFKGVTIGGGVYVPMGYASEWKDTIGPITGTYEVEIYQTIYNLSAAKEVIPNLNVGLSLNLVNGKLEKHAKKTTPGYTYSIDFEGDGSDFEGVLGAIYKIQLNLSIGAVYRTGSKITFEGRAKRDLSGTTALTHQTDYDQIFRQPSTYGLGIAYRPLSNLTLTLDWNRTDWSSQRDEITYASQSSLPFVNEPAKDLGWKATNKLRLGAEYQLNDKWVLRAGFMTDPSPMPDKAVSLTNLIDVDRTFQAVGAGYSYGNWQFDFGFQHTDADRTAEGVKYEKSSTSAHASSSYKF